MTSQTIIAESTQPTLTQQSVSDKSVDSLDARLFEKVKHLYKSDHQAEYLDINAQVESLLHQLQTATQSTL